MKICNRCKDEKQLNNENFRKCKYSNGNKYFKAICRECERKAALLYNKQHKDAKRAYEKVFLQNNPNYRKKWKKDNRDKINMQYRERLKTDISFKLRKNCSRAISRMLKANNSSKLSNSIRQFLSYSIEELKLHLENKFDNNMSWANYGIYWEIDHIIPQSDLPYDSMDHVNFQKCWSLENLRPYPASLNRSEGASKIRHNINNNVLL
jgi:hypothetical protein